MMFQGSLISLLMIVSAAPATAHWACPTAEPTCKLVFVVHDSWHAAVVLRKSDIPVDSVPELLDFPNAEFIEFSWGDKDYFPDPDAGVFAAIKAAFWSSGSVLHLVGFSGNIRNFYRSGEVVELRLTAQAHERMIDYISDTFSRPQPKGRAQAHAGLFAYSRFYPATRKFSLLKTCNTWVAEALKSAGLPISPINVITADSLATQMSGLGVRE
jgi:uncharacterized protein (TIGR02117 family)